MPLIHVGVPLIAVNPFQNVAELYGDKMVEKYKTDSPAEIKVCEPKTNYLQNDFILILQHILDPRSSFHLTREEGRENTGNDSDEVTNSQSGLRDITLATQLSVESNVLIFIFFFSL